MRGFSMYSVGPQSEGSATGSRGRRRVWEEARGNVDWKMMRDLKSHFTHLHVHM